MLGSEASPHFSWVVFEFVYDLGCFFFGEGYFWDPDHHILFTEVTILYIVLLHYSTYD